jgi:CheY-like chemotaxis protein
MINILLIEDDDVDVMNVQRAFKKGNITSPLFVARHGQQALEMLRDKTSTECIPNGQRLILLDMNMPKMSGIEFLQELRADVELRTIPVVMLTTSNEDKDRFNAYNLNVAGYLLKPVEFPKFVDMMTTLNKYWTLSEMI